MTVAIAKPITGPELKAIHALWRQVSMGLGAGDSGLGAEQTERELRLGWISNVVSRPLATSKDLSNDEALKVIEAMKQETGQAWRSAGRGRRRQSKIQNQKSKISAAEATRIAELAADLWGERWNGLLAARLQERFRVPSPQSLAPAQARLLVEELLQRLAVRHIADRHQPPIPRVEIEAEKARLRRKYFSGGI